jgi:cAMP-specific phosphodiesterase 4
VTATVNFFISKCEFYQIGNLSKFDLAYMYLGAACHDYQHPGVNNMFLINTRSELAFTYNDKSPLENHHVSASFIIMRKDEYDILSSFSK